MKNRAFQLPFGLRFSLIAFISFWALIAILPLFWIVVMSFKLPIDAFAKNPLQVIFGFETAAERTSISVLQCLLWLGSIFAALKYSKNLYHRFIVLQKNIFTENVTIILSLFHTILILLIYFSFIIFYIETVLKFIFQSLPLFNLLLKPLIGITLEHYYAVWLENAFYENFINSLTVTFGVVTISLTIGTLAGYALARSQSSIAFWFLIIALIFRALPHSVLVTGYLPVFINSKEILTPLWESPLSAWFFSLFSDSAPTFYGKPLPVIIVLVAINQPFTIWMLRSFFLNIPSELDEAARVDGCSTLQAFRRVIMPVMWPGVITAGLFSFLLAYNDYLVTALLLDNQSQTMVPAISQYFNRETTATDQVEAVAAAVSIVIPLFFLVMIFQKQIVSGLTQGAVKG